MADEARDNLPNEAESSTSMYMGLQKEMRAINTNITAMHDGINNLVVVDEDSEMPENGGDVDDAYDEAEREGTDTASVVSVDTKVEHLLTSAQTSQEESATTSQANLLSSIAQDLTVSEKTGNAVHKDLANIVASLLKDKLPDEEVQSKLVKYRRPENIDNLQTPRVNPLIWNHISASVRSTDVKYQKIQQSCIGAIYNSAMIYTAEQAVKNNCDKTLVTALTDGVAMATQCQHDLNHTRRLATKKELNQDLAALCNRAIQSGEFLFGDLTKLTKDITETNKLTKRVRSSQCSVDAKTPIAPHRTATKTGDFNHIKDQNEDIFRSRPGSRNEEKESGVNEQVTKPSDINNRVSSVDLNCKPTTL
jgi:hypothetical protein